MTIGNGKPCTICGTSDWYANGNCKKCQKTRNRKYYRKNPEYHKEQAKEWYTNNKERHKELMENWLARNGGAQYKRDAWKKYAAKNKDKIIERRRKNRAKHADYMRKWRANNREHARNTEKIRRTLNKDRILEVKKAYRANNPGRVKAWNHKRITRKTQAGGSFSAYEWRELCKTYDYRCLACGKQFDIGELTADHIVSVLNGGTSNIDNIQPLCKPCNSSKGSRNTDLRPLGKKLKIWKQPKLPF